jgi:hypothetical protein
MISKTFSRCNCIFSQIYGGKVSLDRFFGFSKISFFHRVTIPIVFHFLVIEKAFSLLIKLL